MSVQVVLLVVHLPAEDVPEVEVLDRLTVLDVGQHLANGAAAIWSGVPRREESGNGSDEGYDNGGRIQHGTLPPLSEV